MISAVDTAPLPDELEVSIFGPGKGEALAIHLGAGDWLTVDSCRDQVSGGHPVLSYFDQIGVSPDKAVRLVVGTHAHDDHIAGLSELYSASRDAQFVTSAALTSTEFYASIEADASLEAQLRQSVRAEYRAIYAEMDSRPGFTDGRPLGRKAFEQRDLWTRPANGAVPAARVLALSPSDTAIDRANAHLARGSAKVSERKRLAAGDPNEFAIALWVEVGSASALLGADLLIGPEGCGWKAVLNTHKPQNRAQLHKVPHHGSPNAHHPDVWSELLDPDVLALVAPFRGGNNPRPNADDVRRISSLSHAAYATAQTKLPTPSKATKKSRALLSGLATNVREPYGQVGQVRARSRKSGTWEVEVFGPAYKIK